MGGIYARFINDGFNVKYYKCHPNYPALTEIKRNK